jgi:hypothetical protein
MIDAKIKCSQPAKTDFSKIPDTATKITSNTIIQSSPNAYRLVISLE